MKLLNKVCEELNIYLDKEWESNFGDIQKITPDGKLMWWNNTAKRWQDDSKGWADLLTGYIQPKSLVKDDYNG